MLMATIGDYIQDTLVQRMQFLVSWRGGELFECCIEKLKKRVRSTSEEASSRSYAADAAAHNEVFHELMF